MQGETNFYGIIVFSLLFLLAWAVTTGMSVLGSRVPLIFGLLLDFFSRCLFAALWVIYVAATAPGFKKISEEYCLELPAFTLFLLAAFPNYVLIFFPLIFLSIAVDATAFGLLHRINKDLATVWTFFASTVTLICCSMTILAFVRPLRSMLAGVYSN